MGQSCSFCDSDRQGEINLDDLRASAASAEHSPGLQLPSGVKQHKEKKETKEKKEKKDKKAKKDRPATGLPAPAPEGVAEPRHTAGPRPAAPELAPLGLTFAPGADPLRSPLTFALDPVAAAGPKEEDAADKVVAESWPVGPTQEEAEPRAAAGSWRTLPSVGTWLRPLPRAAAASAAVAAGAGTSAGALAAARMAQDEEVASCQGPPVERPGAADDPDAWPFPGPVVEGPPAPPPALEEVPDSARDLPVAQEGKTYSLELKRWMSGQEVTEAPGFEECPAEIPTWPSADKAPGLVEDLAPPPAEKPAEADQGELARRSRCAGATAWHLRPSVGTWLRAKARPQPAAAPAPTREPTASLRAAPAVEAGGAPATVAACPAPAAGVEVSYGSRPASPWPQEAAPLATPLGDPHAEALTTTTLVGEGRPGTTSEACRPLVSA